VGARAHRVITVRDGLIVSDHAQEPHRPEHDDPLEHDTHEQTTAALPRAQEVVS